MNDPQGVVSVDRATYDRSSSINASLLKKISPPNTPAHFKAFRDGPKPEPTDAQRFGLILHRSIFEPDTMEGAFAVKPEGMNFATTRGREWKKAHEGLEILKEDDALRIKRCVESVWAHPYAKRILSKSQFEKSIFATDENGVHRKGRLDIFTPNWNGLADLKSCDCAAPDEFERDIVRYGYHYSAAFYIDLCALIGAPRERFFFICVEKNPPHLCVVYELQGEVIEWGRKLYQRDLLIYRQCMERDEWPGYTSEVTQVGVPMWSRKEMEAIL